MQQQHSFNILVGWKDEETAASLFTFAPLDERDAQQLYILLCRPASAARSPVCLSLMLWFILKVSQVFFVANFDRGALQVPLETVVVVWSSRPLTKTLYSRRRGWERVGIWDAAFANSYDDMHRAQWSRRGQMFDSFQWLSALIQKHQITHWLHTDTLSSVSADWEGQRQSHCPVTMNTSRLTLIQETC